VRILLDTHVMLWWALGNEKLSNAGRALVSDERNECMVSVASLWEVSIKSSLGRGLPLGITAASYCKLIEEAGFVLNDVRKAHALGVEKLDGIHGDPFDRLMVSHARVEGLKLLTHDKALAAYGDFVIVV
jgi:PIN domain nuclease of toxin-antitoxin system